MRRIIAVAAVLSGVALLGAVVATTSSASTSAQRVRCISNGSEHACTTPMRLVCYRHAQNGFGRAILSRIVRRAHWMGTWHISFIPSPLTTWVVVPVKHRRVSFSIPAGTRREEAIVSFEGRISPTAGPQVLIWARCR